MNRIFKQYLLQFSSNEGPVPEFVYRVPGGFRGIVHAKRHGTHTALCGKPLHEFATDRYNASTMRFCAQCEELII